MLSLRKNRHKQDLIARRNFLTTENLRHSICPYKLKGIPEKVLDKFRIKDNNLDNAIQKALEYLCSKDLDEVKFGSFLFWRYFQDKINEEEAQKKVDFHIEKFIEKGVIGIFGNVLNTENNLDIITGLTVCLINITFYGTIVNGNDFFKEFMTDTYIQVFYKLIQMNDNEIIINLYIILFNCICESENFAKKIFKEENFIRLCIQKYLEPKKPTIIEQSVKNAGLTFFVSLTKIANTFNEKQINTFYKIFEKLISLIQDSEIFYYTIIGLKSLFLSDKFKIIFNSIKNNNYGLFDKIFISFNQVIQSDMKFDKFDSLTYSILAIVKNFIYLSEENDIIFLLQNTQLLNFIDAFYNKMFFQKVKNITLEVLLLISHHSSNVIINMVKGHETFLKNVIKEALVENSFNLRIKAIEIVYYNLNLISLDINVELFRVGIIEQLITYNLINEEDSKCLLLILNGIIFFINSIKSLENQWNIEIINNLIKIGITNGLDYNITRFNEEHNILINQIKTEIKNILNSNANSVENNYTNNNTLLNQNQMKTTNININNPISNNENRINV